MKKTRKVSIMALIFVVIMTLLLSGCSQGSKQASTDTQGSSQPAAQKIKVAFVYVGPVGDFGYTYAQDQGRKYLEANMKNVETTYVENIAETADCERVFTELAQKGNNIIIGTSYGYMDYMVDVSKKFPNVVFEHCSGYKTTDNLGTYFNRDYQARFLTGMVAGKYTKSNVLGFVAPFGTPEVIRNIDAFTLGAQSINPKVQVKVVWTNSWNDPGTEKTAANSLIDAGADVLAMHVDSPTFAQTAQDRGVLAIGHDSDMSKFAPNSILVGDVSNWGPYFVQVVKDVMNKTWKPTQYLGGIKDGGVIDITPFSSKVDKDFQATVNAKRQDIIDGKFDPFQGPVYDQSGNVKIKDGDKATDQMLLSVDWFVKGVVGTIPKS
ncbi:BMP family ABC transporter substrate-binding protein [Desulfosporosinus sp. PR]|uniref:BMP family ABC transporter substrate-binding protein n=1 Tax=Candidatus Desulfosporosinus nitrosoreducens TaxID=3401928 RepID=UPI0027F129C2|nr:BMP family ABC transporter substrate-binding protein [Desulfosporosinus sp. PR]MDQ7093341.1 BMP family ABC transporter substrate-binding protein [Desulfosporosinus sp. PR]